MTETLQLILTSSVVGVLSSSLFTFITFLINRHDSKKEKKNEDYAALESKIEDVSNICLGLAYDRIIHVGESYLKRGSITIDEREDFRKYLWGPYHEAGGNGSGDAMMASIDALPIAKK